MARHIRHLINKDIPTAVEIENASFDEPWPEELFRTTLRDRKTCGMVYEQDGHILGFVIFELLSDTINIVNLAVVPGARRKGVGGALVAKMIEKMETSKRKRVIAIVRETNLPGQLFFRRAGFRAVTVMRNCYEAAHEDGYLMRFASDIPEQYAPQNRTSTRDPVE
jgi:ribosomal-protein-alanine N-acetyltransferase